MEKIEKVGAENVNEIKVEEKEKEPIRDFSINQESALNLVTGDMSRVNPDVYNRDDSNNAENIDSKLSESAEIQKKKKRRPVKGLTDKHGNPFDYSLHEVGKDGSPVINKKDGFLKMKPGRPKRILPKSYKGGHSNTGIPSQGKSLNSSSPVLSERRYSAEIYASLFAQGGVFLFGDEWIPRKDEKIDELKSLSDSIEKYLAVKNVKDLPPGASLALGLIGYAAVRMHLPKTKTKFEKIIDNVKIRVYHSINYLKNLFKGKKSNASYANRGNDGIGKNDTSEKVSG